MPDTVELDQSAPGVPVGQRSIDVLGNDLDPLGLGLSVVAVEGAERGEVVVADDASDVLYTPEAGLEGSDSFVYTLEDGAGRRAQGTVTVSVDLIAGDEPDCVDGGRVDGCVILTELDGHGLGRLPPGTLVALLAVLLGRGRHRLAGALRGARS